MPDDTARRLEALTRRIMSMRAELAAMRNCDAVLDNYRSRPYIDHTSNADGDSSHDDQRHDSSAARRE